MAETTIYLSNVTGAQWARVSNNGIPACNVAISIDFPLTPQVPTIRITRDSARQLIEALSRMVDATEHLER